MTVSQINTQMKMLASYPFGQWGIVAGFLSQDAQDPIAKRLAHLGFRKGARIRIVARGPFGLSPLLIEIGATRFALRRFEAQKIMMQDIDAADAHAQGEI